MAISLFTAASLLFIELHEQGDHTARLQVIPDLPEELAGIERGGTLDPWVERIGGNRVELLVRGQQVMTRIVVLDVHLRVADDVEVVLREVRRDDVRHQPLDFGDGLVGDEWIDRDGPRGHAGAAANHEDARRVRRYQRRDVTKHPLQPHVLRFA